jgi:hypothetical protein
MGRTGIAETELYPPIKAMLEGQGYEVKGEIGAADVVAVRDGDDPVIVELKTTFSLSLFHQAAARQTITDAVYIAVPRGTGKPFLTALKNNKTLCRRLGLGLLTVRLSDALVEIHLDPAPYRPRKSDRRKTHLLREFAKRSGDPSAGGSTRRGLMTAYRQDALRCLAYLCVNGASAPRTVAAGTGVETARNIMADNHYGWFDRVERGVYAPTEKGEAAAQYHAGTVSQLTDRPGTKL